MNNTYLDRRNPGLTSIDDILVGVRPLPSPDRSHTALAARALLAGLERVHGTDVCHCLGTRDQVRLPDARAHIKLPNWRLTQSAARRRRASSADATSDGVPVSGIHPPHLPARELVARPTWDHATDEHGACR